MQMPHAGIESGGQQMTCGMSLSGEQRQTGAAMLFVKACAADSAGIPSGKASLALLPHVCTSA